MITSGALRRAKRAQRSIMVRRFGHLSIPEILVITCPLTPARPLDRPSVRTTGIPIWITQLQSNQVKRTPPRFYYWIDYLKNESVSRSRNWCQIQSGVSACVMSSEYFTRTSLYLVRLEIFEWIKLLRRHLHQFQENGAGRNFITASRANSRLITHATMQRSIWNLQLATDSTFEK